MKIIYLILMLFACGLQWIDYFKPLSKDEELTKCYAIIILLWIALIVRNFI